MSVFPTLITWTAGQTVTASQMNTNVRDGSAWLKAALDLLTNTTSADTGTTMYVQVRRTASTDAVFEGQVGAEANPRIRIDAAGKVSWGAGGASALDTFLSRTSAAVVALSGDTQFQVVRTAATGVYFSGIQSGDAARRITLTTHNNGGGELHLGDGTTSNLVRLYYDTSETVLNTTGAGGLVRTIIGSADSAVWSGGTTDATNYFSVYNSAGAGTATLRWLNGTTVDAAMSYSVPYVQVTGGTGNMFYASDGLRTKAVAGAVSDGSFGATPSSGHFALDATNSRWYARSGSTWRYADLMGAFTFLGPFTYTNLAASQTNLEADLVTSALVPSANTPRVVTGYAGDIVCITVRGSAACTTSTATFKPSIAGGTGSGLTAVISSAGPTLVVTSTQAAGIDTFTSTEGLSVMVTTTGTFAPTTIEYVVYLGVLIRR